MGDTERQCRTFKKACSCGDHYLITSWPFHDHCSLTIYHLIHIMHHASGSRNCSRVWGSVALVQLIGHVSSLTMKNSLVSSQCQHQALLHRPTKLHFMCHASPWQWPKHKSLVTLMWFTIQKCISHDQSYHAHSHSHAITHYHVFISSQSIRDESRSWYWTL